MDMKRVLSWLSAVVVWLAVAGCSDNGSQENPNDRLKIEVENIDNYLSGKGVSAVKDPTGIRLVIYYLGTGYPAKLSSTIEVDYDGRFFPDGSSFDSGTTKKQLLSYIDGWKIALGMLPEGSRARVYIPSAWAYGPTGNPPTIPADATLEFDIEFNELVRTSAELAQLRTDSSAIDAYLTDKGIVAEKGTLGLRHVVTQEGNGTVPGLYDKLKFSIRYRLLSDDTKTVADFDFVPTDEYYSRAVDQNADGVKKMLTTMPVGSKVTAYMPSLLAFGTQGAADNGAQVIPVNASIIVDIELKEIVNP
ncbi:MAG TPA: FKBP-type peptidyl-prolyl cis-trans isomerase [Chryseolinea sp.]|nr:FKBP-type peptidyl-prolyl cis-trans isomerase [Chryseolinea sp.]